MPAEQFLQRIAETAQPYFAGLDLSAVRKVIEQLPPDGEVFVQVSQYKEQLQLEIGFSSGKLLIDVTFRADTWMETLMLTDHVDYFAFKVATATTELVCHSQRYAISYTASTEQHREALDRYWRFLQNRFR